MYDDTQSYPQKWRKSKPRLELYPNEIRFTKNNKTRNR